MQADSMILVSVDDHLVEPPNLFEGRLASKFVDEAPWVVGQDDGSEVWILNAVAGRVKDMNAGGVLGSMCFPSFPGFAGRLFATHNDKELALARSPTPITTGTSRNGAEAIPGGFSRWGCRSCGIQNCARKRSIGTPKEVVIQSPSLRTQRRWVTRASMTNTGIRCDGRFPTPTLCCRCTWAPRAKSP